MLIFFLSFLHFDPICPTLFLSMKIRHFSLFCVMAKIWIQTCNSSLFFLCTWQNKTYVLTNLDSGLSNLTTKMLKIDPLCQNGCILFIVVYSCSPRKTLSILELECVKTRIISNERFKVIQHIPYCIHTTIFETIILL